MSIICAPEVVLFLNKISLLFKKDLVVIKWLRLGGLFLYALCIHGKK